MDEMSVCAPAAAPTPGATTEKPARRSRPLPRKAKRAPAPPAPQSQGGADPERGTLDVLA
jgi:hypothetical protein